jgi:hypothetical protein
MSAKRIVFIGAIVSVCVPLLTAPAAEERSRDENVDANPHSDTSLFTHSENCVACHNKLTTPSGEDVSIGSMWSATIMANSARDPYWQAAVRRETIDHPTRAAEIEDECASCHAPMAQRITRAAGRKGQVFAYLPLTKEDSPVQRLAGDGISCTVCHQIARDGLGTRATFNANFVMRPTPADGARRIFGRHDVDAGRRTIMRSASGFVQEQSPHITQSELCASCHTLITTAYDRSGSVVGQLHEQMTYQEWQHSEFATDLRSCQSCHMPAASGPLRIASVLGEFRDTLARHLFVGGNAYMVRLLNRYRTELGVTALPAHLESIARATEIQLEQQTARVALSDPQFSHGTLAFDVAARNLTGHKFPTGYPARRTWLHVRVTDSSGDIVFESGAIDDTGAIRGNDNDADPLKYEPHYEEISGADQVQIYEPILGDLGGRPTTGLLTATQYLKDNRLLPRGFDKSTADQEIGVYGTAARDPDFASGGDTVRYRVSVSGASPFRVDVELRYQAIGHRWAHNLRAYDAAEAERFVAYYAATSYASSVVVATAASVR